MRNSCAGTVALGDDSLPESGRPGHGIGLRSVASIAKHYGGTVHLNADEMPERGVVVTHYSGPDFLDSRLAFQRETP